MNILVVLRQTIDLVEELDLRDDATDIDREYLTFTLNEWDEQALEEALLLKDSDGASVTVVALEEPDVDQTLYTALAKGADHAVKLTGEFGHGASSHRRAAILAKYLADGAHDLILTGVQTPEDLDGPLGGILAAQLGLPHAAVAVGVTPCGAGVTVSQELGAGVVQQLQITGRAVVAIQAARQPPRYVPVSRIRAAMQTGRIDEQPAADTAASSRLRVRRMFAPEPSARAEMLSGDVDAVAARIVQILHERGVGR